MILLDSIRAFDAVSPRIHLDKLSSPQVDKTIVGNVLVGWAQRVAVTGVTPGWHWSLLGFQGSVPSPVLLNISISSLDTAL